MKQTKKFLRIKSSHKQKGMTFIEVIVALFIIVTGILGAVALQASAKQGSFDAMQRSIASSLAQDIIARMRANAPAINPDLTLASFALSDYGTTIDDLPGSRCRTINSCTSVEMATNDRYEWELALMGGDTTIGTQSVGGLIGGRACITGLNNFYTVTISWQGRMETADASSGTCGQSSNKGRQIVVQAFIF